MNHVCPPLPLEVLRGLRMHHPTHLTPWNHNRMWPPHVHGEPEGGEEVPEMLLFFLALVVLAGPTLPAPFAVDEVREEQS